MTIVVLSFKPRYHEQISDGRLAGAWRPIPPPASKSTIGIMAQCREGEQILREGGNLATYDLECHIEMLSATQPKAEPIP